MNSSTLTVFLLTDNASTFPARISVVRPVNYRLRKHPFDKLVFLKLVYEA